MSAPHPSSQASAAFGLIKLAGEVKAAIGLGDSISHPAFTPLLDTAVTLWGPAAPAPGGGEHWGLQGLCGGCQTPR